MEDVTTTLYTGGRHEMLNETNRDEVMADVVDWVIAHAEV
jgi:alpha-beta hydrolase superfamily lysophospholipase